MARRRDQQRTIVGASTRINMSDRKAVKAAAAVRPDWQNDAWEIFDLVPEVKQPTWLAGNAMAKVRLFAAVDNPNDPDGEPIPVTDPSAQVPDAVAAQAVAELARLRGAVGGPGEILRELSMNFDVAGEGYIIGRAARPAKLDSAGRVVSEATAEDWSVRSVSEVDPKSTNLPDGRVSTMLVRDKPKDKGTPLDPDLDTSIRFWQRHPRWSGMPDSAVHGVLDDAETLVVLQRQQRAEALSHIPAGILKVPNGMKIHTPQPPATMNDPDKPPATIPFSQALRDALVAIVQDPSHPGSLSPIVVEGEKEDLAVFDHLTLSRDTDATIDERIKGKIDRIARGLNMPVEKVMGLQSTTFANAWQVDRDTFNEYYEPRVITICDILTSSFLRPQLVEAGQGAEADPENEIAAVPPQPDMVEWAPRIFVWFDPSAVIAKQDPSANANDAFDRFVITDDAYRKAKGFSEDDAPDAVEVLIRSGLRRGILTADLTRALLELLGTSIDVEPLPQAPPAEEGVETSTTGSAEAAAQLMEIAQLLALRARRTPAGSRQRTRAIETTSSLLAAARRDQNPGRALMDIDRDLRSKLIVAADRALNRALERAGAVLRSKMRSARDLAAGVELPLVAATIGVRACTAAGFASDDLLDGAFDSLEDDFMTWGAQGQRQALDVVSRVVSGFSTSQREALQLRQAADLTEAWGWLKGQLNALGSAALFDPNPAAPALGEIPLSSRIPPGMIRQALTRAGGIGGVSTADGKGAWVSMADAGARPAGQLATGELVRGAIVDGGGSFEAYRWVYGPAPRKRPFEPHVELDGLVFENFDDPELSNPDSFPSTAFYMPGDHDGCICDFEPIIVAAEAAA